MSSGTLWPVFQAEARVMEAAFLRAPDEGDIVRLVAATEERADDRLPVTGDDSLGQMKA
jgi:hypothetical protein